MSSNLTFCRFLAALPISPRTKTQFKKKKKRKVKTFYLHILSSIWPRYNTIQILIINTLNLMRVDSLILCFLIFTVLLPALPLWVLRRSHDAGRAGMMAILQMRKLQSREVKWGPERPNHISNFIEQPGRYHKHVNKLAIIKHRVMGPEAESTWPTRKYS